MRTTSVDYCDFILVVEAYQRKENGGHGIIYCSKHVDESAYFKREEDAIEKWNNLLPDNFRTFFTMESIIEIRKDYSDSTTEKLRTQFSGMSTVMSLVWCGRLLRNFHDEKDCPLYMSSALKFYLKAFEIVIREFNDNFTLQEKTVQFLRLSLKHRVHSSVLLEILRVFYLPSYGNPRFGIPVYSSILEDIFKITTESGFDILDVLKSGVEKTTFNFFYNSLFEAPENFIVLLKFGRTECFSTKNYYWPRSLYFRTGDSSTVTRSLQVLQLYLFAHRCESPSTKAAYALRLLWNSISDPFLRQEEFNGSFDPNYSPSPETLERAWNWYGEHVFRSETSEKSPRSLRHLSRCFIREQLAKHFKLPPGVENLPIPWSMKEYVLLKDCDDSV